MAQPIISSGPGGPDEAVNMPDLKGVSGCLGLRLGAITSAVLEVRDGEVRLEVRLEETAGPSAADAFVNCDEPEDLVTIVTGGLNPVVAALQGRIRIEGDMSFAAKVLIAFNAASPFKGRRLERLLAQDKEAGHAV